tara:strand:- start:82 stop:1269 length:1188 start_codon:yes stop_codon:yes gene_type:complete
MLAIINKIGLLPFLLLVMYLIDPFYYGFLFGYLIFLYFFLSGDVLKSLLDQDVLLLTLFSTIYSVYYSFDPIRGTQFIFIYLLFPPTFYLLGKHICNKINNLEESYKFLIFIFIIYSVIALISIHLNIMTNGFVQINRDVSMIWSTETITATGLAAYLFANMCIPALLVFNFKKNKLTGNIVLIIIYLLSIIAVLRLGSRTQIGISLLTLFISIIFSLSKQSIVKRIISILFIVVLSTISISYLSINKKSDLLSAYSDRMDSKKFGASTAGGRTERWTKSLDNLIDKPLGWSVNDFGYSHNLWLDTARAGTILAFILLVIFTISSLIKIKRTLSNESLHYLPYKNMVLILSLAFYLQFFVEPILEGSLPLFIFYCFFQGIVNQNLTLAKLSQFKQ